MAALALYLVATDGFNGWRFNVLYAVFVALIAAFYGGGHPCRPLAGGVFLHAGVYSGGFCRGADMADVCIFCALHRSIAKSACLVLFIAAGFGIIFGLMWLLEDGGSTGSIQFDIRPRTTCIAAVMAAAIYILSSISYTQLNTPFSARGTMEIYTMRTVVYFGGVALLFAYQSQLRDLLTQREADALRNMLHIQYENYKIRQESIDLINQKYHT